MWTNQALREELAVGERPQGAVRSQPAAAQQAAAQKATVSIVSHGQALYVRKLLRDLDQTGAGRIDKVIVTVNIDEPDRLEDLQLAYPVELIRNERPKGYGANHNAAFQRCVSPWFLVLNPDVRIEGDAVARLLDEAPETSGVVAPRIVEPGKTEPEPRRALLTPFEIMGRWVWPRHDAPRAHWVAGMFMLFRAPAFRAVGGFDEKFYMYVEDADICARLHLGGWAVAVNESVRVLHDAQRASDRQWRALGWHWASLLRWWVSAPFWRLLARRG
jgi:GT2 family glycosyltransferase